jgi:GNAT superfamily N-acetyltransferase
MTVIKFAPGLKPVLKHQEHDQSTHGNWADSGSPKLTILGKNDGTNEYFNESTRVVRYQPEKGKATDYVLYDRDKGEIVVIKKPSNETTINGFDSTYRGVVGSMVVATGESARTWRKQSEFDGKATVAEVGVDAPHRRRGLASAMLRFHRDRYPELDLQHSDLLLQDGKAWADVVKHEQHDQSSHGNWADGSSGSGLDAMPYGWKPEFREKERLTSSELSSKEVNLGREQLKQVAAAPTAIRLFGRELNEIVELGRFKTLEEQPDLKNMSDYREARQDLEVGLWGVPEKDAGPIYGYFDTPLQPSLFNQVRNYGEATIFLKDSVAGRTTITAGDSANHGLTPVLVTDARKGNLSLEQVDSVYRSRYFQRGETSVSQPINSVRTIESIDYFEAQIHGGISLKDIKSVDVRNQSGYSPPVSEATKKILKENGIEFIQND